MNVGRDSPELSWNISQHKTSVQNQGLDLQKYVQTCNIWVSQTICSVIMLVRYTVNELCLFVIVI